jgi:hypothetical protein
VPILVGPITGVRPTSGSSYLGWKERAAEYVRPIPVRLGTWLLMGPYRFAVCKNRVFSGDHFSGSIPMYGNLPLLHISTASVPEKSNLGLFFFFTKRVVSNESSNFFFKKNVPLLDDLSQNNLLQLVTSQTGFLSFHNSGFCSFHERAT